VKTLIVEDDFTNRLVLQRFPSRYGECHVAVNGKEAIEAFRLARNDGRGYDLICMDILMPEMDGHQAVQEIRGLEKEEGIAPATAVRIFMTTALSDLPNVTKSAQEHCDDYLLKPIDTGRLLHDLKSFGLVPA